MKKVLILAMLMMGFVSVTFADEGSTNEVDTSTPSSPDGMIPVHGPRRAPARVCPFYVYYEDGVANVIFFSSLENVEVYLYEDDLLVDVMKADEVEAGEHLSLYYMDEASKKKIKLVSNGQVVAE